MISIFLNDKEPIYLQIIKNIKIQIAKGELRGGQIIMSRREMATQINVNPNTVQKAYKEMEAMGIIENKQSQQSKITTDLEKIKSIRNELIESSLKDFLSDMKLIEVQKEEIIDLISKNY